jgi:predicted transcriptional regulator
LDNFQGNTVEHQHFGGVRTELDDNGEPRISAPADTHYVRSYAQRDAYLQQQQIEEGRKHRFTFTDMDNIKEIIEKVSDKHCGYLLFLQCFVSYNSILANPDKSAMTPDDMMKTLRIKRSTFYDFLKCMVANNIIYVDKSNGIVRYMLNPRYHFQGKTKNTRVIKSFTSKVKALYGEVTVKDLGFVYKLLPFVHFETNTICDNPYETDVERTQALDKSDISRISGLTEKAIYTKLRNLKLGDEYIFAEVVHGKQRFYKINPFVFYRKNSMPDATLREMFSMRNNYGKRGRKPVCKEKI